MNFHILTLFPDMVMDGLNTSIIGRAQANELLTIEAVNIRDFAVNKHNRVDDYTYGGGAGMLMQAEPVYGAYKSVEENVRASRESFISHRREKHFRRRWRKNLQRKRKSYFYAVTMKELTRES